MKILLFVFIMALMVAMTFADSSEEREVFRTISKSRTTLFSTLPSSISIGNPFSITFQSKPRVTMKFLLFTCLLAVALAKHELKQLSSSEKYRQDNNVVIQTNQESATSSSSEETGDVPTDTIELTEEEKVYLNQLSKINQFYQAWNLPQYLEAYHQQHSVRNPWNHIKTNGYHLFPLLVASEKEYLSSSEVRGFPVRTETWHPETEIKESTSVSQEETSGKIVDMGTPEEVQLNDEEKNYLKQLVKINQYQQKFTFPHYFQAVHPQQIALNPWNRLKENTYPFILTLKTQPNMKILVFAFIMALMVAMIGADSSEEEHRLYPASLMVFQSATSISLDASRSLSSSFQCCLVIPGYDSRGLVERKEVPGQKEEKVQRNFSSVKKLVHSRRNFTQNIDCISVVSVKAGMLIVDTEKGFVCSMSISIVINSIRVFVQDVFDKKGHWCASRKKINTYHEPLNQYMAEQELSKHEVLPSYLPFGYCSCKAYESISISQEEITRNINELGISESAEVLTEKAKPTVEKKIYLQQLDKINQFYQNLNFLQYLQALHQPQIVMNPWDQIERRAYSFIPSVNREQLSTSEETSGKTVDMESTEVVTKKIELTEEEKKYLTLWNKINQYYQKFTLPQYLKTVQQYQAALKPWNHNKINAYQITPTLNTFKNLELTASTSFEVWLENLSYTFSYLPYYFITTSMLGQIY
ncbi:alpha-S2-casein-like isoform X2 [Prionailurus iriomotensis]